MELNGEIIRQLYKDVTSSRRGYRIPKTEGSNFTQYTVTGKPSSLKSFYRFFATVKEAFPDYELIMENLIVKGDRVMARYTISGTHQAEFMGIMPTHEKMAITGIDVFRLDQGQVVEHWDAAHQVSAFNRLPKETTFLPSNKYPSVAVASSSAKE